MQPIHAGQITLERNSLLTLDFQVIYNIELLLSIKEPIILWLDVSIPYCHRSDNCLNLGEKKILLNFYPISFSCDVLEKKGVYC